MSGSDQYYSPERHRAEPRILPGGHSRFQGVKEPAHKDDKYFVLHCMEQVAVDSAVVRHHQFSSAQACQDPSAPALATIAGNGMALQYIHENAKTPKLCLEAIRQNGLALQFVPEAMKTYDMCQVAVCKNGMALQYVPYYLRTYGMRRKAISQNGSSLEFVPDILRDAFFCITAYSSDPGAIRFFPPRFGSLKDALDSACHLLDVMATSKLEPVDTPQMKVA